MYMHVHVYMHVIQRFVGVKTAPVASGPSVDRFITTKESRRFPEMPALPPLVSSL